MLVDNNLTQSPSFVPSTESSCIPSLSPSFVPTATAFKTEFGLTFLSDDTIIDFEGTSPEKEIIIKTLISKKAPREFFEQTILVAADCQSKLVDEYPGGIFVTISSNQTLDVEEGRNIQVTSEIDIDTSYMLPRVYMPTPLSLSIPNMEIMAWKKPKSSFVFKLILVSSTLLQVRALLNLPLTFIK